MKLYKVTVMAKYSNGRYGKVKYQSWGLQATSKKNACDFAYDIVAGMTWREIFSEQSYPRMLLPMGVKNLDETIGYEFADKRFSYRAEIDYQ